MNQATVALFKVAVVVFIQRESDACEVLGKFHTSPYDEIVESKLFPFVETSQSHREHSRVLREYCTSYKGNN